MTTHMRGMLSEEGQATCSRWVSGDGPGISVHCMQYSSVQGTRDRKYVGRIIGENFCNNASYYEIEHRSPADGRWKTYSA